MNHTKTRHICSIALTYQCATSNFFLQQTKLVTLSLLPTFCSHIFAVSFFICIIWFSKCALKGQWVWENYICKVDTAKVKMTILAFLEIMWKNLPSAWTIQRQDPWSIALPSTECTLHTHTHTTHTHIHAHTHTCTHTHTRTHAHTHTRAHMHTHTHTHMHTDTHTHTHTPHARMHAHTHTHHTHAHTHTQIRLQQQLLWLIKNSRLCLVAIRRRDRVNCN